jgi:hypothetical protein
MRRRIHACHMRRRIHGSVGAQLDRHSIKLGSVCVIVGLF